MAAALENGEIYSQLAQELLQHGAKVYHPDGPNHGRGEGHDFMGRAGDIVPS